MSKPVRQNIPKIPVWRAMFSMFNATISYGL